MAGGFRRHIAACNNLDLPGNLVAFRMAGATVGWLAPPIMEALASEPALFDRQGSAFALAARFTTNADRSAALADAARALAERGLLRLRGEAFDVRAGPDGPVVAVLDRGAIPVFGIVAQGVHLNGLVRRAEGLQVWVGFRSRHKAIAPGQLDHLVAGGIPAGLTAMQTLVKEAAEEASLPPELAAHARPTGTRIGYVMRNEEGVRRDRLHAFDLVLPNSFVPRPQDDEVERFELWPARRLLEAVRDGDEVKFNVNLVLIDLFLREGLIPAGSAEARALREGLAKGP
jgi:8-oxo-dGTP pyrophosphatase MutT (NUDIX family)